MAGTPTANNIMWKPPLGPSGEAQFLTGFDTVDARLAKEIWVGDPNYGATLQTAITAMGATPGILRVPAGTWSISSNLTVPANVTLHVERGAILSVANSVTLTINGPFEAGLYQTFNWTGSGKVVLTQWERYVEWWGAKPDNSTDCTAALNAAIGSIPSGQYGCLDLQNGIYRTAGGHTPHPGISIEGKGKWTATQIIHTGANICFNATGTYPGSGYYRPRYVGFSLVGTSSGLGGMKVGDNPAGFEMDLNVTGYTTVAGVNLHNITWWCEQTKIWLYTTNCLYSLKVDNTSNGSANVSIGYADWDIKAGLNLSGARGIYMPDAPVQLHLYNSRVNLQMWTTGYSNQHGWDIGSSCLVDGNDINLFSDNPNVTDGTDNQLVVLTGPYAQFINNRGITQGYPDPQAAVFAGIITPYNYYGLNNVKVNGYAISKSGTVTSGNTLTYQSGKLLPFHNFKVTVQGNGTNYIEKTTYLVTCSQEGYLVGVDKISGGPVGGSANRITVVPKGGGTQYALSLGNGCAVDIVVDASGAGATDVTYYFTIEAVN